MVHFECDAHADKREIDDNGEKGDTHLYSTPSLIIMGFFLVSASFAVSASSKTSFLPGGSVGELSSRVRTVTWRKRALNTSATRWTMNDGDEQAYLGETGVSKGCTGDDA